MSEVSRWYPSKVDWWLAVLLVLGPLVSLAGAVAALVGSKGNPVAFVGPAVFAAIYGGLVFPMRYGISEDALVVRYGLMQKHILLRDITEVYPTSNPLSSPALSLDRLHIQFGEGLSKAAMISPADKEGFLKELAARAGLRRDGERLTR